MNASEPRVRRRGFFLHSDTGEPDMGEHENPEGFIVRVRLRTSSASRKLAGAAVAQSVPPSRFLIGRLSRADTPRASVADGRSGIKSANATDSRPRARLPR